MTSTLNGATMDEFGALVRRYRDKKRWSQESLAFECEMDHSLVSRLERGERPPTRESIGKLCAGLKLSATDAHALWLAGGLLPPDVDAAHLLAALALVQRATHDELLAAVRLIQASRAFSAA